MTPEEILTGRKPSVAHLAAFKCKVWVRVAGKVQKRLEPKAKCGVQLRCPSYGDYRLIFELDRTVHVF